jgi:hypothetical protein
VAKKQKKITILEVKLDVIRLENGDHKAKDRSEARPAGISSYEQY